MKRSLLLPGLAVVSSSTSLATLVLTPIDITAGTGSSATQSTPAEGVTPPGSGFADRAINGNLGDFTHTTPGDPNPNLTVDLGRDETFSQVIVHNRDSCCGDRLSDITLTLADNTSSIVYTSAVTNIGNALGSPATLTFNLPSNITARSINVARAGGTGSAPGVLSIGEIQIGSLNDVMLPLGTNLTAAGIVGMTTAQSPTSASPPGGGVPGNAVDGNLSNFTHTNANLGLNHTWQVDFGELMFLESVDLSNRANCCGERLRDIEVSVLDESGGVVITSGLLNEANALNFLGTNQDGLSVDLTALNGGAPVTGQTVVVTRFPDPTGGLNADDGSVLSLGEVVVTGGSIPEPSTGLLAGLAAASLLLRRKRG
jgi:hypothetical protein